MIGEQRVLVVEDSATSRKIVTRYLEDLGLQVESTTNGLDAITMLRRAASTERPFTILVTDLVLPGLDGYGLIEPDEARAESGQHSPDPPDRLRRTGS